MFSKGTSKVVFFKYIIFLGIPICTAAKAKDFVTKQNCSNNFISSLHVSLFKSLLNLIILLLIKLKIIFITFFSHYFNTIIVFQQR